MDGGPFMQGNHAQIDNEGPGRPIRVLEVRSPEVNHCFSFGQTYETNGVTTLCTIAALKMLKNVTNNDFNGLPTE
jgi:hypothetical protein